MKKKREQGKYLLIEAKGGISGEVGKYLLDISKLVIGGVVLTSALNLSSDSLLSIVWGIILSLFIGGMGFAVLIYKRNKL